MTAQEIRKRYLEFFKKNGHAEIPRAPLVPLNDPTTLFTGSGMQPLVPYLLGESHPEGSRLVDSQTCLRAEDMDEVGDNRHTTFFEMLGNWSLGDYFKDEQLKWFFEFLVNEVGLDPSKLYVTCFIGDEQNGVPKDTEASEIWKKLFAEKGIKADDVEVGSEEDGYSKDVMTGNNRIFYYDAKKNWWSRAGVPANMTEGEPGGPDSEVFYCFDEVEHDPKWGKFCHPNCDCGKYMEIGNSVFMAYKKTASGFEKLPKPNVDFGGGLERIAAAKLNDPDMFKISLLWPVIEALEGLSGKKYDEHKESMRVIADHLRAAVFLITDGVFPSNNEQGYVVRRLMRRAIRFAFDIGIENDLCAQVAPVICEMYSGDYPEVEQNKQAIIDSMNREEKLFRQTLQKGDRELRKMLKNSADIDKKNRKLLSGGNVFKLYDTYGYPKELTQEMMESTFIDDGFLSEKWEEEFEYAMKEQQDRSRTAGKGVFKGGLADHSVETTKLHTSHHLLLRALKDELGNHVFQRGSNITAERLRIDFSHPEKVTRETLDKIEEVVNAKIAEDLPVIRSEMPREKAEQLNAEHEFGAKYPDMVSVYSVGPKDATQDDPKHEQAYSIEFCGGPHVEHTGVIAEGGKKFKIKKEQASSAGVRRIKAVLIDEQ